MTGQPYLRQVRFLVACAAVAAVMAVCFLSLIRMECDHLAAGAASERALRSAWQERLTRLGAASFQLATAAGPEEFAAAEAEWKALGGHSEELPRAVRSRMLSRELQREASRTVVRENEGAPFRRSPESSSGREAAEAQAQIRESGLVSSARFPEQQSRISTAFAAALRDLERAPQPELAGIRAAEQTQESALQQVALLSAMVLLAGLAGAALLISAGRILTRQFRREFGALQSLYKHTVRKTKYVYDKMPGVAVGVGKVAEKLAPAGTPLMTGTGVQIESARAAVRALQIDAREIGRMASEARRAGLPAHTSDRKGSLYDAGDASDCKLESSGLEAPWIALLDTKIKELEKKAAGIGDLLAKPGRMEGLRDVAREAIRVPTDGLAPEQEQLYKLAAALSALCGKPGSAPVGPNQTREKSTARSVEAGIDRSVLLPSGPGVQP